VKALPSDKMCERYLRDVQFILFSIAVRKFIWLGVQLINLLQLTETEIKFHF